MKLGAAFLLTCLAVAATGGTAAGRDGAVEQMTQLLVIAGGKDAHARVGSYCLSSRSEQPGGTDVRECSSVVYDPHPKPVLRVAGGSTVVVCAGRPAMRVRVALVRDSSRGPTELSARRARRLDRAGQCWRSKLARRLGAASSLDMRVSYGRRGYADFVVGIKAER
jgi:hypothetical protein